MDKEESETDSRYASLDSLMSSTSMASKRNATDDAGDEETAGGIPTAGKPTRKRTGQTSLPQATRRIERDATFIA